MITYKCDLDCAKIVVFIQITCISRHKSKPSVPHV